MSIVELFETETRFRTCEEKYNLMYIERFMKQTVDLFLEQSDMIAGLRQELAKKEDVIDVSKIKEVKRLNG